MKPSLLSPKRLSRLLLVASIGALLPVVPAAASATAPDSASRPTVTISKMTCTTERPGMPGYSWGTWTGWSKWDTQKTTVRAKMKKGSKTYSVSLVLAVHRCLSPGSRGEIGLETLVTSAVSGGPSDATATELREAFAPVLAKAGSSSNEYVKLTASGATTINGVYPTSYCSASILIADNPRVRTAIPSLAYYGLAYTSGKSYRLTSTLQFCTKIRNTKTVSFKVTD